MKGVTSNRLTISPRKPANRGGIVFPIKPTRDNEMRMNQWFIDCTERPLTYTNFYEESTNSAPRSVDEENFNKYYPDLGNVECEEIFHATGVSVVKGYYTCMETGDEYVLFGVDCPAETEIYCWDVDEEDDAVKQYTECLKLW